MPRMIDVKVTVSEDYGDLPLPYYQTDGSSGLDLYAAIPENEPIVFPSKYTRLIPTGIFLQIPQGYEAQIRPRSGFALKKQVTVLNSPGTIDSDYREEVGVILTNFGNCDVIIERGYRIAQMVFAPVTHATLWLDNKLDDTSRKGGFGSTGKK